MPYSDIEYFVFIQRSTCTYNCSDARAWLEACRRRRQTEFVANRAMRARGHAAIDLLCGRTSMLDKHL